MSFHSIETEQAQLGSILKEPDLIYESILSPEHFFDAAHELIYETMITMRESDQRIDPVSLVAKLGERVSDMGGVQYLIKLSDAVPSVQGFNRYERIIKDKYLLRTGAKSMKEIYGDIPDDPKELAAELMSLAENIGDQVHTGGGFNHIGDGLMQHFELLENKKYNGISAGVSTIGKALDKITGRWQKQTLNIIAARPSVGKTAFMLQNAVINGKDGMAVAIFSLEQPEMQLYDRIISAECSIDGELIRTGKLTDDDWTKYTMGMANLAELKIYIDDKPGQSVQEIRAAVRKLKKKHTDLIVFIDYLQLIQGGKRFGSRTEEVGYISNSLKQMARENDCPVIALAQLSRSVEQRQDKRPMMSDLRESGNIEQDADTITFLYRDDYYNQETEKKNIIECIVAKNRNGAVGTAEMVNMRNFGRFVELERVYA
ncbi:replicative DNA helicase [Paenibacillus sp. SSG-1]|uniref:replicative DNA helicase n=1 Tax=Paenibacillus sp. SSG-1 TaxID=1443669 RepID=UPI000B7E8B0F|nr:replicative DNA helicase [Paenibacillus sp. SSG-1]OXL83154.1 replicative DNA helicase [Paenibacillus sp. SSG-1]